MVMYDNDFERKENKILNKGKIAPQQIHALTGRNDLGNSYYRRTVINPVHKKIGASQNGFQTSAC